MAGVHFFLLAEFIEHAWTKDESTTIVGTIPHYKVLVGIALVELHELYSFRILLTHDGISQTFCSVSLTYTWSTLENQILLYAEDGNQTIIYTLIHKDITKEVLLGVGLVFILFFLYLGELDNLIVFSFSKTENAAIPIGQELHARKLRSICHYRVVHWLLQIGCFTEVKLFPILGYNLT